MPRTAIMASQRAQHDQALAPSLFSVNGSLDLSLRLPTAAASFAGAHDGRNYFVYANKGGFVNIVDIVGQRLVASLQTYETIVSYKLFVVCINLLCI